ncbi:MAG: XisI protein [Acidobacteria bacterium]|nr:XisI protein [Acidobacteriota bacterium]
MRHGRCFWIKAGWSATEHIDGTTLFTRIRDGKCLIEEDWTAGGSSGG